MADALEYQFDKYHFRVPTDCLYAAYDTWARLEGDEVVVGITDFLQTKMGDIAFAEMPPTTSFEQDDILATLESTKATVDVTAPASGELTAFNSELDDHPELINQDPHGKGWIARLRPTDWEGDRAMLLSPEAYLELMKDKVAKAFAEKP
ncbi:MAG: glycine cleavage system protein H [Anaerolineae bacterium]